MSHKLEYKIKSWNDVSLANYDRIAELCNDEMMGAVEKDISLISILCDVPEEKIWDLTMDEVNSLRFDLGWLSKFDFPKNVKYKRIKIGDYDLKIDTNLQKFSIAQYVDFQTYIKDEAKHRAELMSVFLIPKGKKYGDGYDLLDLINTIKENMDIITYNSILFFFVNSLMSSTRHTVTSLVWKLRMRAWLETEDKRVATMMRQVAKNLMEMLQLTEHISG